MSQPSKTLKVKMGICKEDIYPEEYGASFSSFESESKESKEQQIDEQIKVIPFETDSKTDMRGRVEERCGCARQEEGGNQSLYA